MTRDSDSNLNSKHNINVVGRQYSSSPVNLKTNIAKTVLIYDFIRHLMSIHSCQTELYIKLQILYTNT